MTRSRSARAHATCWPVASLPQATTVRLLSRASTWRAPAGKVFTWGDDSRKQIGVASATNPQTTPVMPSSSGAVAIDASSVSSAYATVGGEVYAWGGDDAGQLGDGQTTDRATPA